jgi:hypothetical protein
VRASSGLDALDAVRRQCAAVNQELGVLSCVDIVGYDSQLVVLAQEFANPVYQRGLA